MKNKKYLYILLIIIPIIIFFVGRSYSLTYTQEIRNVEIESNDYNDPGSWHIDKSAKWTSLGKAQIEFNVDTVPKIPLGRNIDIILVIDVSGSMDGDKFDRAISDAKDLTSTILSTSGNRMALITFDTDSEIISGFTNNKNTMLDYLDSLSAGGNTNYNAGLLNVDEVLDGYTERSNTDLLTLFLTDGYPNEDVPTEKATYRILKEKYPYMTINGVQYELGQEIIQDIIDVSDNQWSADQETLNNILFEASVSSIRYETFVISDYINKDYFTVNSVDDIKVNKGEVELTTENGLQKVIWTLDDNSSGFKASMKINVNLKSEYYETNGFYPTNDHETIDYNLYDEDESTVNSTLTPVLKNNYYVIYNTNAPSGCTGLPTYQNETHFIYQTVTKKTDVLTCPGYIFKGWQIDSNNQFEDLQIINDDTFIMPGHDVTIRATWAEEDLVKSMDGTVRVKLDGKLMLHNSQNNVTFGKTINRNSFESIITVDNIDVPANAIDNWDVSYEQNGSVIAWYTDNDNDSKYELYIGQEDGVKANPNSSYTFMYFTNAETIDLTNFDTTGVTDMRSMFERAGNAVTTSLNIIGLNDLNTSSVTSMNSMFYLAGYNNITFSLDMSNWDVSNVNNMYKMFDSAGYKSTRFSIDLSNWDTKNVTNMSSMFNGTAYTGTTSWSFGDISGWNTSNVTDMSYMFQNTAYKAPTFNLNLSSWNVSKVTTLLSMFNSAGYTATTWSIGDLSGWMPNNATNFAYMFQRAGFSATTWNIGNINNWNVSKAKNMSYMFSSAGNNATTWNIGSLNTWNTSSVTNMSSMFASTGRLSSSWSIGDISGWDTSKVTSMTYMFNNAGYSAATFNIGNIGGWDTSKVTAMDYMFARAGYNATTWNIGDISGWDVSSVTNMRYMFSYAGYKAPTWNIGDLGDWTISSLVNANYMFEYTAQSATTFDLGDLDDWDTSSVINMNSMFSAAGYSATTWNIGDLSGWTTSSVTDMSSMFATAGYKATTWDVGNLNGWDTSSVTNMSLMFSAAGYSATTWNIGSLSGWNTGNVNNMEYMFYKAGYTTPTFNLILSGWNTSKVTSMGYMFSYAGYNATTWSIVGLNGWNTGSLTQMAGMFNYAGRNATTFNLDLSNWDVSKVKIMSLTFAYAGYYSTSWSIGDLSNWDTSSVTNMGSMFQCAAINATSSSNLGTLNIYSSTTSIMNMFTLSTNITAIINIYGNPTTYTSAFSNASTNSNSGITINYSSATTNIDAIIATASANSNVVKGIQLD